MMTQYIFIWVGLYFEVIRPH